MKKTAVLMLLLGIGSLALAAGNVKLGEAKSNRCAVCHGNKGAGDVSEYFPPLAGKNQAYLIAQIKAFRNNTRIDPFGQCNPIVKTLRDADIQDIAAYYSSLSAQSAGDIVLGEAKSNRCAVCHGDEGVGGFSDDFPPLAGKGEAYLIAQIKAFRNDTRLDPRGLCNPIVKSLSDKDIQDIAAYYANLPAKGQPAIEVSAGKRDESRK